ncbi:MAG: RHS repeat-associated core domain-containing protein, partial [Opitutales bacterium]|nr:RHS repeat-associated core domain-containing protein [Opitutales bacterium]
DGYLCIQVLYSNSPYNVFKEFVWDPTESVATRPLVFRYAPNSLNLFYAFDGNKNVSDVFYRLTSNGIGAHYDYAPFGATTRTHRDSTASFDIVSLNPFRFSSEYYDSELDLIYYNYRHYSPDLGRWLNRDPIEEQGGLNLYAFVRNSPVSFFDLYGMSKWQQKGEVQIISKIVIDVHIEREDAINSGVFIPYGITTWEITGRISCVCGTRKKEVFHKKQIQKKRIANVNAVKLVGPLPPGASTIATLVSTIFAEAIQRLMDEAFLTIYIPPEGEKSFKKFLEKMNTPPRIDSGFWTGDLCNEN